MGRTFRERGEELRLWGAVRCSREEGEPVQDPGREGSLSLGGQVLVEAGGNLPFCHADLLRRTSGCLSLSGVPG